MRTLSASIVLEFIQVVLQVPDYHDETLSAFDALLPGDRVGRWEMASVVCWLGLQASEAVTGSVEVMISQELALILERYLEQRITYKAAQRHGFRNIDQVIVPDVGLKSPRRRFP
jgi:hypothetical protein